MFDLGTLMRLEEIRVECDARAAGREATSADYESGLRKILDVWLNASVDRDMAVAGFVKVNGEWTKPRRSLFGRLIGG